jgi:hypothetical protein
MDFAGDEQDFPIFGAAGLFYCHRGFLKQQDDRIGSNKRAVVLSSTLPSKPLGFTEEIKPPRNTGDIPDTPRGDARRKE